MKLTLFICCLLLTRALFSQTLFYEDEFKGGATASGGSPGAYATFTPSDFSIEIPAGSTIRKAYLFAGRHGGAADTEVDLNGFTYTFSSANQVSEDFYTVYSSGDPAAVHAIDVTADIDPLVSDYTLTILDLTSGPNDIYTDFYLFITYDNPSLDSTFVTIYLNDQDFDAEVDPPWEINLPQPMDTTCVDIALTFMTGYACFMGDGEDAYVNDIYIGTWGGSEENSGDCGGPVGSFAYYDGDLYGLMDDDEDEVVNETDVVATINNYITPGSTYFEMNFDFADAAIDGEYSNAIWLAAVIYGEGAELVDSLVTAGDDAHICKGDTIQISSTGLGDFEWSPAGSLDNAFISDPFAFPGTTTTYVVSVDNGCFADIDSLTVFVDEFSIDLAEEEQICIGDEIHIGVEDADTVTYSWTPSDFLSATDIADPTASPTDDITYLLSAMDQNGCISEDQIDIIVNSAHVDVSSDTTILLGSSAILTTNSDGVTWEWTPADFINCTDCSAITATPPATTTYIVMITDEDGCIDYDTVTVFVDAECGNLIHLPNAFSPNDDNINDAFGIITYLSNVESPLLTIYNRWGEMVFQSADAVKGWDGNYNGKPAALGNYVYTFQFNCFGEKQLQKGTFTLVR